MLWSFVPFGNSLEDKQVLCSSCRAWMVPHVCNEIVFHVLHPCILLLCCFLLPSLDKKQRILVTMLWFIVYGTKFKFRCQRCILLDNSLLNLIRFWVRTSVDVSNLTILILFELDFTVNLFTFYYIFFVTLIFINYVIHYCNIKLYKYISHEYSYSFFLIDPYHLYPYDFMIHNMLSEWYPSDEDFASPYDSKNYEED